MWEPNESLPPYQGPYPIAELQQARTVLVKELKSTKNILLERIKPKIGIPSRFGEPVPLAPPVQVEVVEQRHTAFNGVQRTAASATATSHSELAQPSTSSTDTDPPVEDSRQVIKRKAETETGIAVLAKVKRSGVPDTIQTWPEVEEVQIQDVILQFKCDFCTFQNASQPIMENHLQQARHFSASQYQAVHTDTQIKLIAVHKKVAIKNKHGKNEALVVVCPKCHDIFEDIFMCGLHYKYKHGGSNGAYCICPVIHSGIAVVMADFSCLKCNKLFLGNKALLMHWQVCPSHHPESKQKPAVAFALYSCMYCNKTFYENFNSCKSHVLSAHSGSKIQLALKVRHIMKPMRPEELPPETEKPEEDGISEELTTLRKMKTHFKTMGGTKKKVKHINSIMNDLKGIQKASPQQEQQTINKQFY